MNEAIRLAIEKGWWCKNVDYVLDGIDLVGHKIYFQSFIGGDLYNHTITFEQAVLDPSFWQALGKALGWTEVEGHTEHFHYDNGSEWLYFALYYHELVLTGGDVDAFWKELINKK